MFDLKISGGLVVDGTGVAGQVMDIGIVGDRIVAMGDLSDEAAGKLMPPAASSPRGLSTFTPTMTARLPGTLKWRRHLGMALRRS